MVIQKLKPTNINALSVASVPKQKFPNQESNAINDNEAFTLFKSKADSLRSQIANLIRITWRAARKECHMAHVAETTPDELRKSMNL